MLTTAEILGLTGLPQQTLNNWIQRGHITPHRWGYRARCAGHCWTTRQLVGLAIVAALHQSERSCSPVYAGRVVQFIEGMSDGDLLVLLGQARPMSDGASEAAARLLVNPECPGGRRLPDHDAVTEDLYVRLARVAPVVRAELERGLREADDPGAVPVEAPVIERLRVGRSASASRPKRRTTR